MNNESNANVVRSVVRGNYDLQKLRIQMGNRLTGNFKTKLGFKNDGMTEKELEKEAKTIISKIRKSYQRITDGVVNKETNAIIGKIPTLKKFVGDEIISTYTELVLVDNYMTLLSNEEKQFRQLKNILTGHPIYDQFLSTVDGIGPQMAGVIMSEIDIHRAEYPSSLWKYCGLDVIVTGHYVDDQGNKKTVRAEDVEAFYADGDYDKVMIAENKYVINFQNVGRSRKLESLVKREYVKSNGEVAFRDSITYNPWLKTKLIGVLATSFLRCGKTLVDGQQINSAERASLAKSEGFKQDKDSDIALKDQVIDFLIENGHDVQFTPSGYGAFYYDYKNRLENSPHHKEKTSLHKHNMALRYMIKRFLVDLYSVWRKLEGLPVAEEYSVAKLGMVHGKAGFGKTNLFDRKAA